MKKGLRSNLALSNKNIKQKKLDLFFDDLVLSQKKLINDLDKKRDELKRDLRRLYDFYPDSTTSLFVVERSFDFDSFTLSVQKINIKLRANKVELEEARRTLKYFNA